MSAPLLYIDVEYIESGTFQGGEEDVFNAEIDRGEDCVVMKKSTLIALVAEIEQLRNPV